MQKISLPVFIFFSITNLHAAGKGKELGKVFQVNGKALDVTGAGALQQKNGTRVVIETKAGLFEATIKEQFHTKARILVGNLLASRVAAGDKVYALGSGTAKKTKKVDPQEELLSTVKGYIPAADKKNETEDMYLTWIKQGADVNFRYPVGDFMPLHWAAKFKRTKGVQALIKAGADINARGGYNETALILGVTDAEIAATLISLGADLDHISAVDESALMKLAESFGPGGDKTPEGRAEIEEMIGTAKLLLENGADINLADKEGKTAFSKAQAKGNKMFMEFLRKNGAKE